VNDHHSANDRVAARQLHQLVNIDKANHSMIIGLDIGAEIPDMAILALTWRQEDASVDLVLGVRILEVVAGRGAPLGQVPTCMRVDTVDCIGAEA
jgi:hypothetical protein